MVQAPNIRNRVRYGVSLRLPVEMVDDRVSVCHKQGEEWVGRVLKGIWLIHREFLSKAFYAQCGSLFHLGIVLSSRPLSRLSNLPRYSSCAHSVLHPLSRHRRSPGQRVLSPSTRSEAGPESSSNGIPYAVQLKVRRDSKVYDRDQRVSWACLGDLQQDPGPLLRYRSGAHLHRNLKVAHGRGEKRTVIEETLFQISPVLIYFDLCLFDTRLLWLFMRIDHTSNRG